MHCAQARLTTPAPLQQTQRRPRQQPSSGMTRHVAGDPSAWSQVRLASAGACFRRVCWVNTTASEQLLAALCMSTQWAAHCAHCHASSLCAGSDDFTLFLWEPSTQKQPLARMTGHMQLINQASRAGGACPAMRRLSCTAASCVLALFRTPFSSSRACCCAGHVFP